MDYIEPTDVESSVGDIDLRRARREYVWFSVMLLFIVVLVALKAHS